MRFRAQTLTSGLTMVGVLFAAACSSGDKGNAGLAPGLPCPRGNPEDVEVGAVIRIGDIEAPCRIEFHESEVVLRGDPNGERPDPGRSIVQDSRGRFYSTNASGFPSVISIWDTDGTYLSSFGSVGDGPGELSGRGGLTIFMDRLDRLHVRDGGPRWTVFGNDQSFIRSVTASAMGGLSGTTVVLDDGGAVNSNAYGSAVTHFFRVVDSTGVAVSHIAPVDPGLVVDARVSFERGIAHVGGGTFWAGPPVVYPGYSPVGYVLEEWGLDGTLVRTIHRDVPWLSASWPPPAPGSGGNETPSRPPQIAHLHLDDEGVLMVTIVSQSESWRPITVQESIEMTDEEQIAMYSVRIELIDTYTGALLVSQILDPSEVPAGGFITGTRRGYRVELDDDFIPVAKFVDFSIVTR